VGKRAVWSGAIAPGWDIVANANGGYLLAIAARALGGALDRPDPVTVTGHYFYPGKAGDVTIETQVLKEGRRFGSGRADLLAQGRTLLSCIGTFGDLTEASGPEIVDQGPPEMPDPDDCLPVVATDTFPPPFMGKIELRLHPEAAGSGFATTSRPTRSRCSAPPTPSRPPPSTPISLWRGHPPSNSPCTSAPGPSRAGCAASSPRTS